MIKLSTKFNVSFHLNLVQSRSLKMPFAAANINELYKRDPNIKKEDIQILQEWIRKQPHLAELGITEGQLIGFLHSCYYRIEPTKITIDNYFTMKRHIADLLDALELDVLKQTMHVGFLNILPKKTPEGYIVILMKLLDVKTENFNFTNIIRALNMTASLHVIQKNCENGLVAIFDMKGATLGHLARVNVMSLKKGLYHLQEAFPVRLKSIHFINMVSFIDKIIAIAKPFLKDELYNMLNFHPNYTETLDKFVPLELLPQEYGGDEPSEQVLNEKGIQNLEANYDFFVWHDLQKVDESKRYGKPKDISTIFGVEGTFKKLDID